MVNTNGSTSGATLHTTGDEGEAQTSADVTTLDPTDEQTREATVGDAVSEQDEFEAYKAEKRRREQQAKDEADARERAEFELYKRQQATAELSPWHAEAIAAGLDTVHPNSAEAEGYVSGKTLVA